MRIKRSFRQRLAQMQLSSKNSNDPSNQKSGLLTPNTPVDPNSQDFFSISFENTAATPPSNSHRGSRTSSMSSTPQDDYTSHMSIYSSQETNALQASVSTPVQSTRHGGSGGSIAGSSSKSHVSSARSGVCTTDATADDFANEVADEMAEKILSVVASRQVSNNWCVS